MAQMAPWDERRSGKNPRRPHDHRSETERDLARVVHAAAFRRLQGKTQVLGIGESDFHRTRLTHSMEAAQIGRGIVQDLKARDLIPKRIFDADRIVTICLAHDLGHPPFGHGGEIALNYMMRDYGGFEGNGQTLRILAKQEAHTDGFGLDLTRRTLLGILKYPAPYSKLCKLKLPAPTDHIKTVANLWKPPKCYHDSEKDIVDWILHPLSENDRRAFEQFVPPSNDKHGKTSEKGFDTSIMDLADDIAYGVHDLEDAIRLGLITEKQWASNRVQVNKKWGKKFDLTKVSADLFSGKSSERKRAIGGMVNALISSTVLEKRNFKEPVIRHRVILEGMAKEFLNTLRNLVTVYVIKTPEVQTLEYRGQQIVMKLFEAFLSDPKRLLKTNFSEEWQRATGECAKARVVCDYIAGMTDEYATRIYERLFIPRQGTVFWKL